MISFVRVMRSVTVNETHQPKRAPIQREPSLPEQPLDAGALEITGAGL